jgi:subtilisin family serine protease
MKRKPTKAQLREMLDQAVGQYESQGGSVEEVAPGVSGVKEGPLKAPETIIFEGTKEQRSYVNDVVAAIDSRKKKSKKPATKQVKNKQPKKRLIYDDFGEPLRWVWDDE